MDFNLVMQLPQKYHFNLKNVSLNLLVVVLYVLLAKIGLFFVLKPTTITIFWPAGGFALALLLLGGLKYLPGIFIGGVVAGFMVIDSPWVVTALAMANMLESFSAYWLLTNRFNFNPALAFRQDFFKLVLLTAGIASTISALMGSTALLVDNIIPTNLYPTILLRWWMGDVLGIAFITPLILIWKNLPHKFSKLNAFEIMLIYALTLLAGQIIFFDWLHSSEYDTQSVLWLVLLIIWAGSRAGRHNTSVLQLIIFSEALWSASHGVGHYANDMVKSGLVNFWMFGMLLAVGGMAIAVMADESRKAQEILMKTESYQRALLDNFPFAIWLKDTESRFLSVNKGFATIFGAENVDELVGKNDFDIAPSDLAESYREDDRLVLVSRQEKNVEEEILTKGARKWFETYKAPVFDDKGAILGTVGFARDITERKQAEKNLQIAASVFTYAREGIMITDADGMIIDVNNTFSRITGYSRDEVLGRNPHFLNSDRQDKKFCTAMWRKLHENDHWYGEVWNQRKNGEVYPGMLATTVVRDAQGNTQHYVALFSDITPLKEHEKQLEHIAYYDVLTGLPNRALLGDRLHQAMAQAHRSGQQLAVVFLDLDGFKAINDTHGHEAGDQLLIALATRMKQTLREVDTLARLGGDEFVAVLLDLEDVEASVLMLTRLLAAAALSVTIGDLVLQVSASLGVTFYPQTEDMDADQLLRQADQSMYQAKLTGKNRYHFFDAALNKKLAAEPVLAAGNKGYDNDSFLGHKAAMI
jgi:diguanylate cyclase (GGDEF)-like protein/PAS domain S-box-containing protein